jgi:hypothetical protein
MRNLKCRSVTTESNLTIHLFLNFNTYASDALDGDSKNSDAVSRKNKPTVLYYYLWHGVDSPKKVVSSL